MAEIPLIAVVDDDAAVREAVQSLLRALGLRAQGFASAQDFLQSGQLQDTACLIVDVRMPRMGGLELQQQLSTAHCPMPIIFITAHGDAETRAPCEPARWPFWPSRSARRACSGRLRPRCRPSGATARVHSAAPCGSVARHVTGGVAPR
jgi:CheY-like chemotaxis protein